MSRLRLQAFPRHLHPPRLGRADYAAAGVSALRKEDDDVGKGLWLDPVYVPQST